MCWRSIAFAIPLALCVFVPPLLAKKKPPAEPVNLNTATSEQLQQVPGIGPSTADKILQMRKSYGAFKSVDDLLAVRGIGPKRLEKMRKYLVVGRAAAKPPGAPATKSASPPPKTSVTGSSAAAASAPAAPAKKPPPATSAAPAAEPAPPAAKPVPSVAKPTPPAAEPAPSDEEPQAP
jgi:competence ComEA-like helix-hairpin-helix protein